MSPRAEIERALRFIAEHLDEPLTVAQVARAAHLSEFHFHRLFHAEVGEPVGRFVTRRRLELAALRLAYERGRPITDVALSSGYSSPSNFAKAFKAHFGCSPTDVRDGVGGPDALYTVPPALSDDERRARAAACVPRMETSAGRDFASMSGPGGYGLADLESLWQQLIAHARELGLCDDGPIDSWGIPFDSPAHARMPEGRYAVFTYRGPVDGLDESYRTIYSCWFPLSAVDPDDYTLYQRYIGAWERQRPRRCGFLRPMGLLSTPKRILITGASRGIGKQAALTLASRGRAEVLPMDVTDDAGTASAVARMLATGPCDVVVNNAGTCFQGRFLTQEPDLLRQEMELNYFGAQRVTRAVLPSMIARRDGTIVNVSSLLGIVGTPTTSNYSGTKAALNAWTHGLRGEVAQHGVRMVLFVAPHTQTALGAATEFDGVRSLPVAYTVNELCRAIDRAPRQYAASPVYRLLIRLAGWFPAFMERQVAASVKRLLSAG